MGKLKTAVLISGRGSNLQSLIDAAQDDRYPAEIVLVLSNVPDAYGLKRARKAGLATEIVDHREFPNRETFDGKVDAVLRAHGVEFVCLAGFMRLLTAKFVEAWRDRMINIHPSLLPKFKGLDTHARAIAAGEIEAGCTIHFVRPDMDAGPIIAQATVEIATGDTPEGLAEKVLAREHELYPRVLKACAEGRVHVADEDVRIDGEI